VGWEVVGRVGLPLGCNVGDLEGNSIEGITVDFKDGSMEGAFVIEGSVVGIAVDWDGIILIENDGRMEGFLEGIFDKVTAGDDD